MKISPQRIMNCVEFGFDRSRGFGSARGQFWPADRPTRPYNIASTTVQQVMFVHGIVTVYSDNQKNWVTVDS
jgi:hypothetical protein